jgi:hypothetical protein
MNQAARRIIAASDWFNEYWNRLSEDQARATVQHLRELAAYIDEAARRQQASSDRLDRAIAVTMQVSNQLLTGATEATQSAEQLDMVVRDLQRVIGGSASAYAESRDAEDEMRRRMESVTGSVPAIHAGQMGQMALPAPMTARPAGGPPSGRIAARAPSFRLNPTSLVGDEWGGYSQYGQIGPMSQMGGANGMGGMNGGAARDSGSRNQYSQSQFGQYDQYGQYGQNGQMGPNSGGGDRSW